jgi:hypothetical protein
LAVPLRVPLRVVWCLHNGLQGLELFEVTLKETFYSRLNDIEALRKQMKTKMKTRESSREELDYNTTKVKGLKADKDKLLAKGKSEAKPEQDKREAAEAALVQSEKSFETVNKDVVAELTFIHENRHNILSVLVRDFMAAHKLLFVCGYNAVQPIRMDVPQWRLLPSDRAVDAKRAAEPALSGVSADGKSSGGSSDADRTRMAELVRRGDDAEFRLKTAEASHANKVKEFETKLAEAKARERTSSDTHARARIVPPLADVPRVDTPLSSPPLPSPPLPSSVQRRWRPIWARSAASIRLRRPPKLRTPTRLWPKRRRRPKRIGLI